MDENLIKLIGCFDYDRMKKQCQKYDLTKVTEIDNKSEEQLETCEMTTEEEIKWLRKCISDLQKERDGYKQIIDKAIDKLYCWSEILQFEFKTKMLDILKGDSNE